MKLFKQLVSQQNIFFLVLIICAVLYPAVLNGQSSTPPNVTLSIADDTVNVKYPDNTFTFHIDSTGDAGSYRWDVSPYFANEGTWPTVTTQWGVLNIGESFEVTGTIDWSEINTGEIKYAKFIVVFEGLTRGSKYIHLYAAKQYLPTPTPVEYENIAFNKKVVTSSDYSSVYAGNKAVDADMATFWASSVQHKDAWLFVDLEKTTLINGITIHWFDKYFAKRYEVALSDDLKNWTVIGSGKTTSNGEEISLIGSAYTRYAGIRCIEKNALAYAIKEFRVLKEKNDIYEPIDVDKLTVKNDTITSKSTDIYVKDTYIYNATGAALEIYALDTTDNPNLVGTINNALRFPLVHNDTLIGINDNTLYIYNISNKSMPTLLSETVVAPNGSSSPFSINDTFLYNNCVIMQRFRSGKGSDKNYYYTIYDISTPEAPVLLADEAFSYRSPFNIEVYNDYMYIARGDELLIYSLKNNLPVLKTTMDINTSFNIHASNNLLYSSTAGTHQVHIYDISNPVHPKFVNHVDLADNNTSLLDIDGPYIYTANTDKELVIIDATTIFNPYIKRKMSFPAQLTNILIANKKVYIGMRDAGIHILSE